MMEKLALGHPGPDRMKTWLPLGESGNCVLLEFDVPSCRSDAYDTS